ncbi:hypothetical protein OAE96_02150, partial [Akkermansiaceae bacterium]|nr:hypothetical protein [Akkermansiaceae bacterium]
ATTSNKVVGALTANNSENVISPTMVATQSKTHLICNVCGNKMVRFSELDEVDLLEWKLLTIQELEEKIGNEPTTGGMFIFCFVLSLLFGGCTAANAPFDEGISGLISIGWIVWICFFIFLMVTNDDDKAEYEAKLKEAKSNPLAYACDSPDGGKVVFDRKTGKIQYN